MSRRDGHTRPLPVAHVAVVADPDQHTVEIVGFGDQDAWSVPSWPAQTDGRLPQPGDECLIVWADDGEPWVIATHWTRDPDEEQEVGA